MNNFCLLISILSHPLHPTLQIMRLDYFNSFYISEYARHKLLVHNNSSLLIDFQSDRSCAACAQLPAIVITYLPM